MNYELHRMWKEAFLTVFFAIFWYFPGNTEEQNDQTTVTLFGILGDIPSDCHKFEGHMPYCWTQLARPLSAALWLGMLCIFSDFVPLFFRRVFCCSSSFFC